MIFNRLVSAPSTTLTYDPTGRLYQSAGSTTVRYAYDGASPSAEYDGSSNLQRRYVYGPGLDEPLVRYEGTGLSDRRWYVADERGSVLAEAGGTGSANYVNRYGPYGEPAPSNSGRFGYTGHVWLADAELNHARNRAYNPDLGRFMQTDPIGQNAGTNIYGYVGGDPMNFTDPWGLNPTIICEHSYPECPWPDTDSYRRATYSLYGEDLIWWLEDLRQPGGGRQDRIGGSGRDEETCTDAAREFNNNLHPAIHFAEGIVESVSLGTYSEYYLPFMGRITGQPDAFQMTGSDATVAGELTGLFFGGGRLVYAGMSKGIPIVARSGREAFEMRNQLRRGFRAGLPGTRGRTYEQLRNRYGSDAAVRQAAGRSNGTINNLGALLAAGSALGLFSENGCG